MTKFLRCFPLIILGILTACGGGGVSNSTTDTGKHAVVTLQSIQVSSSTSPLAAGLPGQFTATGSYSDGSTQDLTKSAAWSSSNSSVATVSGNGLAQAMSQGSCVITATQGSTSGKLSLTVAPPLLTSITVGTANPAIAAGLTGQFTATGNYSDNSSKNLGNSVTWSSSKPAIAIISNSGVVTAKSQGSAIISATSGSVSGTATLTVGSPTLVSITVSSVSSSVGAGLTDQFTAAGIYSDGSSQNLTSGVAWSVSNSAVATISNSGLATGKSQGSVSVTATSGTVSNSANLSVTISLVSIAVTPALPKIAPGTSLQFQAIGTFSDGSTQDVTRTVNWLSSFPATATISNSIPTNGLAMALTPGKSTAITASSGSISSVPATLTVSNANLSSIAITPAITTMPLDVVQQFTATGTFSDGSTQDITNAATWTSSNSTLVSITASGAATARSVGSGSATITAASGSVSANLQLTVNAANLTSISIQQGSTVTLADGTSTKLVATGLFNDGSTRDVSLQATWSSSNPAFATVQPSGNVQSVSPGLTTVTAALGSQSASVSINVTNATAVSISVTPSTPSIAPGTQLAFAATGKFSDSSTQVITSDVSWTSSDTTLVTINNGTGGHGIASATGPSAPGGGSVVITATIGGVAGTAQLNVTTATLTNIALTPATAILAPASSLQFTALGTFSDNSTQNLNTTAVWTTSPAGIASVTNYGQATGKAQGQTTLTASSGSVSGSATLVVESSQAGNLVSIAVSPSSSSVPEGIISSFTALGTFSDGSHQDLTSAVTWTSSNASVATVSNVAAARGQVMGVAQGASTIAAAFNGVVGSATVQVTTATLSSLTISPNSASITLGTSQTYVATANFSIGPPMNVSSQVTWSSSDVNIAVISTQGIATSASSGTTAISATLNGVSATPATLTIQ